MTQRLLGGGGMGTVHLAVRADGAFRRKVALKLIRPHLTSEEVLARFRRERQVQANLEHPGIVRMLEHVSATRSALARAEVAHGELPLATGSRVAAAEAPRSGLRRLVVLAEDDPAAYYVREVLARGLLVCGLLACGRFHRRAALIRPERHGVLASPETSKVAQSEERAWHRTPFYLLEGLAEGTTRTQRELTHHLARVGEVERREAERLDHRRARQRAATAPRLEFEVRCLAPYWCSRI